MSIAKILTAIDIHYEKHEAKYKFLIKPLIIGIFVIVAVFAPFIYVLDLMNRLTG